MCAGKPVWVQPGWNATAPLVSRGELCPGPDSHAGVSSECDGVWRSFFKEVIKVK